MPVKVADSNPQWVLNFATKDHWRDPSKLEYIERGLADLRQAILSLELTSLAAISHKLAVAAVFGA